MQKYLGGESTKDELAAEIDALNAEIARLTDASSASGARKDTLKAELADLTARRTEAQVAQAAAEAAKHRRGRPGDLHQHVFQKPRPFHPHQLHGAAPGADGTLPE